MDRAVAAEAHALLRQIRAQLDEWVEEGVDTLPAPGSSGMATAPAAPSESAGQATAAPKAAPPKPVAAEPSESVASTAPEPALAPAPAASQSSLLTPTAAGPRPDLASVRTEIGECTRCRLSEGRTQIVFGTGDADADLMFVGEGPGAEEDKRGEPFVGRAGELLTKMIEAVLEIPRASVYICNIVKCRPPQNRTPLADEVATCKPFLDGQIDAVRPKVIVALGKPATSLLLGREVAITRMRGTWHEYRGIPLMPTLHPAFILRQYTPENRRLVWEDLKAALARTRA